MQNFFLLLLCVLVVSALNCPPRNGCDKGYFRHSFGNCVQCLHCQEGICADGFTCLEKLDNVCVQKCETVKDCTIPTTVQMMCDNHVCVQAKEKMIEMKPAVDASIKATSDICPKGEFPAYFERAFVGCMKYDTCTSDDQCVDGFTCLKDSKCHATCKTNLDCNNPMIPNSALQNGGDTCVNQVCIWPHGNPYDPVSAKAKSSAMVVNKCDPTSCQVGFTCVGSYCVKSCSDNHDCVNFFTTQCVNHLCVLPDFSSKLAVKANQAHCHKNEECGAGQVCAGNVCVHHSCGGKKTKKEKIDACAASGIESVACVNDMCVAEPITCSSSLDCSAQSGCVNKVCSKCAGDSPCYCKHNEDCPKVKSLQNSIRHVELTCKLGKPTRQGTCQPKH